jgi:hypothetical protein
VSGEQELVLLKMKRKADSETRAISPPPSAKRQATTAKPSSAGAFPGQFLGSNIGSYGRVLHTYDSKEIIWHKDGMASPS